MDHGVALIKIGTGLGEVSEFYGVFFRGTLQPQRFKSFSDAHGLFQRLEERA